ncbi:uncharacterized protein LOC120129722 [Hibiscus syriacus]|uniref:uncharacterized protein LOC120129722 n=1 Tax=Hibiscus syriacus TaxID=106335 RepID=UPI0019218319|nr:uncharacterized protein LOC120129722 [Hibiscus syriacus]
MLSKLASLLEGRNPEHGKAPEQMTGEPLYPPGFTSVQSQNVQGTSVPTKVHIDPLGVAVNLQPGPSSHPEESLYHQVPDLDEEAKKNENKHFQEQFKQLASEVQVMKEETPRWREVAVQVYPPLEEGETNILFISTLKAPFLSHLIGIPSRSFADIVTTGEMIEMAIKNGKLEGGESSNKSPIKKKENEVTQVNQYDSSNIIMSRSQGTVAPPQNDNRQGARDPRRGRPQFDPIPCDYHGGNPEHSIENYTALKKVVQALRRRNVINFGDSEQPKVAQNPLPNHARTGINAVTEEKGKRIVMDVSEVESPMLWYSSEEVCHYHNCAGHNIQQCPDFLKLVQGMMDKKEIEFFKEVTKKEKAEICASEGSSKRIHSVGCPIVITPKNQVNERVAPSNLFPYKDNKQVPWRYDCQMREGAKKQEEINEVGHLTRSGRFFFKEPEKKIAAEKGKNVDVQIKEDELIINELGLNDETVEFLKFLKHSEFGVVEQLHKLPASISDLSLILSSEAHRNVLIKVLDHTFVSKELPTEKLERLVAKMQADNIVSFSNDEIPLGMIDNHKALHITVRCKGHVLSRVLISDGSTLNVIPLVTLKKLPVDSTLMRNCQSMVRSFDGTEREVLGKIDIPLTIGPATFEVEFLVMDIKPTYNCLLERHWIHQAGAVSSTLYQRLKFVFDGRLVCIHAEEDVIASVPAAPYVEVEEQAVECPFRSFDNTTFVAEGKKISEPRSSYCTKTGHKLTLGRGTKGIQGLGRQLQGPVGPNYPIAKRDRFGLGYQLTLKEKQRGIKRNRELREARLTGEDPSWGPMTFPPLSVIFTSAGYVFQRTSRSGKVMIENALEDFGINVVTNEEFEGMRATCVYPAPPGFVLNNWTMEESPLRVEQEDKQILPHEELTEIWNLGTDEDKRSKDWYHPVCRMKAELDRITSRIQGCICLVIHGYAMSGHKIGGP